MPQKVNTGSGSAVPVGTGERIVRRGECLISISDQAGHYWETIWNDPSNSELKQVRGAPHVLLAGDRLYIPPLRPKTVDVATDQVHRFRRKGIPVTFEIQIYENGEPLSNCPYVLELDGAITEGTVRGDGVIKVPMKPGVREGELRLRVNERERVYPLYFGELDPPHTVSGAIDRLRNLGYAADDDEESYRLALTAFQKDHDLEQSGQLDDATATKLASEHGS